MFGQRLIKQAVNVESKCRTIQLTGVVFLRKESNVFDHTKIMQALGRVDHGFNDGLFYTSAFRGEESPESRRPVVSVTSEVKFAVQNADKMISIASKQGEKGMAALLSYLPRGKRALQNGPKLLKEMEDKFKGLFAKDQPSTGANSSRAIGSAQLTPKIRTWVTTGWPECVEPQLGQAVGALVLLLEKFPANELPGLTVDAVQSLFVDNGDDSPGDVLAKEFLSRPEVTATPFVKELSNRAMHCSRSLLRSWGLPISGRRNLAGDKGLTLEEVELLSPDSFQQQATNVEAIVADMVDNTKEPSSYDAATLIGPVTAFLKVTASKLNEQWRGKLRKRALPFDAVAN